MSSALPEIVVASKSSNGKYHRQDEPLDDAVRRLLRERVEEIEEEQSTKWYWDRFALLLAVIAIGGIPTLFAYAGADGPAFLIVGFYMVQALFGEEIDRFIEWVKSRTLAALRRVKP